MFQTNSARQSMMDCPNGYLIRVIGELDKRWLDYFEELSISIWTRTEGCAISTICAHRADQAAVFSLLNRLYDLGYPIFYFARLDSLCSKE